MKKGGKVNMESETKAENPNDENRFKKGRHRKKQLYNSILQQMEFYFSDSNLTKDRFLSQLLQENPYVELNVFLKFNKIRKLTSNVEDIKRAIKKSKLIELSEDNNSVCRKEPVKEKPNVDECTIYVERLQSDATHEWLTSVFSEFGNVVYVSIPKYKHNGVIKGFAFIEFEKDHEAEKAVGYFESIGCKMPSHAEPAQLCSIATFEGSNEDHIQIKVPTKIKKRNDEEDTCSNEEGTKPRAESSEEEKKTEKSSKRKFKEIEEKCESEDSKTIKIEGEEVSESDDTESKRKKKLKKEHKKKNYIKDLGLQVLSKKEWKRMRNRYLDLQKKKMQEFKKHLYRAKYGQANYEEKPRKPKDHTETEKSGLKMESEEKSNGAEKAPDYDFQEGLIVKIKLPEPITDGKKLKNDIKSLSSEVKYVDIPNVGSEDIYVRFSSGDSAKEFCTQEFAGKKEILTSEEEKSYWEKLQQDRDNKFQKSKNRKERGRDKLLKKAKRMKFDD